MGSLKQFIICSTNSIIKWEHQKKENTILPRLNSLLHTTEHGVIWGNRVGRGNIRRNNGRFCVFSFLYLQDLFIHSNCLESTYCELTEICINSTLRSVSYLLLGNKLHQNLWLKATTCYFLSGSVG